MEGITLRVHVIETGDDWMLVTDSPYGRANTLVPKPFAGAELATALHDLENANLRSAAKLISRKSTSPEMTARDFGKHIGECLFRDEVNLLFDRCRAHAREQGVPLRLLLETTGENVARIPWEFAADPRTRDDYLALRVPVARSLSITDPVPPLAVKPPLRVLGVQARPKDLPELDYQQEQLRIAHALDTTSSDLVEVTWLPGDRWRDIDTALQTGGWHILHFIGHGGFSDELQAGYLELSDDNGNAHRVSSVDIGRAISRSRDLRLVLLNACDSATSGGSDVFASTAAKLMREGVPAVVAMQYEITDEAALTFSAAFYEAVARNQEVDQAVTFARETVRIQMGSLEWATPVLFLASEETAIFDVQHREAPRPPPPARPQQPGPAYAPTAQQLAQQTPQRAPQQPGSPQVAQDHTARRDWVTDLKDRLRTTLGGTAERPQVQARAQATPPLLGPQRPEQAASTGAERPAQPRPATPADETRIAMVVGPHGQVLLATAGGGIRAWSLETHTWKARCSLPPGITARRLAWHPAGRYVASGNSDGTVAVWDLDTETRVRLLSPGSGEIRSVAFSHNGQWLAVAAGDRTVQVYDVHGRPVRRVHLDPADDGPSGWTRGERPLGPLLFAAHDRNLVVATNDGRVSLLDSRGAVAAYWPHDSDVTGLAARDDTLATFAADGRLRVWSWAGTLLWRHDLARADHLAWSDDGRLVVASQDGTVSLWSETGESLGSTSLDARPIGVGFWERAVVTGAPASQLSVWRP